MQLKAGTSADMPASTLPARLCCTCAPRAPHSRSSSGTAIPCCRPPKPRIRHASASTANASRSMSPRRGPGQRSHPDARVSPLVLGPVANCGDPLGPPAPFEKRVREVTALPQLGDLDHRAQPVGTRRGEVVLGEGVQGTLSGAVIVLISPQSNRKLSKSPAGDGQPPWTTSSLAPHRGGHITAAMSLRAPTVATPFTSHRSS